MAAPPPQSSHSPPGTPLSESGRPHSELMEDSDPQATRKRPRLDSGSRVGESLSLDGACSSAAAPASQMDVTPDSARPSKVTINMKSPTSEMPPGPANQASSDPDTPSKIPHPGNADDAISVSSSPIQSPEIEVAEPEDMDQDPNNSTWRPLEEALQDQTAVPDLIDLSSAADLLAEFPKIRENANAADSLNRIILLVDRCDGRDATLVTRVKQWLDECTRNLDLVTPVAFTDEPDFWDNLPLLIETIMRRGQELFIDEGKGMWRCLEEFILNFARLAMHFIQLDMQVWHALSARPDIQGVECMSQRYLEPLSWLLQIQNLPYWRVLGTLYDDEPRDLVERVRAQFITESSIKSLSELTSLILENAARCPNLVLVLNSLLILTNVILDDNLKHHNHVSDASDPETPSSSAYLTTLHELVLSVDNDWQEWIKKKAAWLGSDLTEQLARQLMRSHSLLCHRDEECVHRLEQRLLLDPPHDLSRKDRILIVTWGWKLGVLRRHITEGRMELRVFGVETMQSDLVQIWKHSVSAESPGLKSPWVQYVVNFIQSTRVVDYLVGVDSHPQLISRSSNIVGFLIVTSTYSNSDTDVIWKTVTESQDSRIIAEVLNMLVKTFYMHTSTSPALLYTCSKVLELPLDRFDVRMLEFCESLLRVLSDKPADQATGEQVDAVPLRLCVRLIRESTAAEDIPVDQKTLMQNFGSKHLEKFIKARISDTDRMELYERCIQDIAEMNQFTAGSLQALNALIPSHDSQEIWKLATEFDLTRLVIKDLLHTVNDEKTEFSNSFSHLGLISRVGMLFRLIDKAPDTITPELGSLLWNDIFLSKKLGHGGLKAVWSMMVNALGCSTKPNPFLERCIYEYLPGLDPTKYSTEVLAFAKQSIIYEVRFKQHSPASDDEVVVIPGMDRIWTIILTAPPASVENEAMKFAIEVYLDHAIIRNAPRSAVEATHIDIAKRCIDQLKSAATTLMVSEKTPTNGDITMQDGIGHEMGADEIRFRRSLVFLRQFLYGLRSRPHYSPPRGSPPNLPERPLKGSPIELNWQSFNGDSNSKINTLRIGDMSSAAELVERFSTATGFSKLTAISGGQRIDLLKDPDLLIKDLKLQHGLLIIQKAADAHEVARENKRQALTHVDQEVLQHFDQIYEFLSLRDDLARDIFEFLSLFAPQERIISLVKSDESSEKDIFPLSKPFVALYSFNALSICLREEAIEETINPALLAHSIRVLVAFLMQPELSELLRNNRIILHLTTTVVECLLFAFAMSKLEGESISLIEEPTSFIKNLLGLVEAARSTARNSANAAGVPKLICNFFAILIEGSMKDHKIWTAVKEQVHFEQLIEELLLKEECRPVRVDVSDRIRMICGSSKLLKYSLKKGADSKATLESPRQIDMLATIWESLSSGIPKTLQYAFQSAEFFKTTLWVFNSITDKIPQDGTFSQYLREWSEVMFQHQTEEFVGRELADELIFGFSLLLELCIELADACKIELDTFDLAERLLSKYLFPELSPDDEDPIVARVPVMHSMTRQRLYSIVSYLCKRNGTNLLHTLNFLDDLVPRDESYGPSSSFDRSKMIRAAEGYAGLKNLSNTCYLNSLMTQLFMNVEFREFMLQLHVVDPDSSQRLLDETQRLFACMQGSWSKHVDPQGFVDSIRTYDNEAIDVTIQMDVDEFYNLLFDRWEAQVVGSEDKKRFRSFYGGQLVQQIKSKECSHISERLEPFSAIQCDIKGKVTLEESLQAYVEGEIMQGDNKYSCTACGKHVDAVKRACLKDVPDNLIFHLKRFDFDITTLMRSKINDEFQFPQRIDMTPYKVEYLSDADSSIGPDVFELVGVLVHTGTAESGHYYSYTQERPSASNVPSWVEFNDSDVSRFDPSTIADHCFGGHGDAHSMGGVHVNKVWNAYMLFYQRVSTIDESKKACLPLKMNHPVQVSLPLSLSSGISLDNEILIRTYCLLDQCYIKFVEELLELPQLFGLDAPNRTELERLAIRVGLETYEQLVARTKEYTCYEEIFSDVCQAIKRSPHAALEGVEWVCDRGTALQNIILRISNVEIRARGIMMIVGCLKTVLDQLKPDALDDSDRDIWRRHVEPAIENVVGKLNDLWTPLQAIPRAWDDYFGLLVKLSEAGPDVIPLLLKHDFLLRCLQLVWLERDDKKHLRHLYPAYCRLQEKGRRYVQGNMIALLYSLLNCVDLTVPALPDDAPRTNSPNGKFYLSMSEADLIWTIEAEGVLSMLFRLLTSEQFNHLPVALRIVGIFAAAEPEGGFLNNIVKTLKAGLRFSPADLCTPFLKATVHFCENAPSEEHVAAMIYHVAQGVDSIGNRGGLEHYEFFQNICSSTNTRAHLDSNWFASLVISKIPEYGPTLLMDQDRLTRQYMLETINEALFNHHDSDDMDEDNRQKKANLGRDLTRSCVDKIKRVFATEQAQPTDPRVIHAFKQVIPNGLKEYFDPSNEEDLEFIQEAKDVVEFIEQVTTDVPEDLVSESELPSPEEWEATSALASDSEMGVAGSP